MTIRQHKIARKDGVRPWFYEYTDPVTKKRIRKTPASGLKNDAKEIRKKIEREIGDGTHKPMSQTVTFAQAAEAWRIDCERRNKIKDRMAGNTYDNLCRRLRNHTVPALGGYKLTEIKTPIVQEYINRIIVTNARGTVLAIMQQIYQILEFAVAREWLVVHPLVSNRVRVPMKAAKEKEIPTHDEMVRLLAALVAPKKQYAEHEVRMIRIVVVTLGLFTGMRRGEILGLQWENIDFERREISVRHNYSDIDGLKATKTTAGIRKIPISGPVYAVLHELRQRKAGELRGFVVTRKGHPLSPKKFSHWIWYWMKDLGMVNADGTNKYSMHTLRHCAVSLLIQQGLLPMHIQRIIGHKSIATTMDVYGHLIPGDDSSRVAIDSIADRFGSIAPTLSGGVATTTTRDELKGLKRPKRDLQAEPPMITMV